MRDNNDIQEIESNFDLTKTTCKGLYVWPMLRQSFHFQILNRKFGFSGKLRTRNILQLLSNHLYGLGNLFKLSNFDYVFFNNADKRTLPKDGKQFDVFFDAWADKLGQEDSLFIEWARDRHFSKKKTYSKHVISDLIFKYGILYFKLLTSVEITDPEVLEEIKKAYNIDLDVNSELKNKLAEVRFYRWLFRRINPKIVFLISSFTKVPIVVAAHLEGLKVYEAQHGFVGANHQFYNSLCGFDQTYYPDYFIGFGNFERNNMPDHFIFGREQILPVGSLYLETIGENYHSSELENMRNQFDKIFCVTLQGINESELLEWVSGAAKSYRDFLFILMPRDKNLDYTQYTRISNCICRPENNVYQVLKYSDYNITIYSTTAVEAEYFGVKTLFFNYEGLSEKYFDVKKHYAQLIDPKEPLSEKHLDTTFQKYSNPYFVQGYHENVMNTEISI